MIHELLIKRPRNVSPVFLLMSLDLVECASRASARNKKPPAMRVVYQVLLAQKSPFRYDRVVQATI